MVQGQRFWGSKQPNANSNFVFLAPWGALYGAISREFFFSELLILQDIHHVGQIFSKCGAWVIKMNYLRDFISDWKICQRFWKEITLALASIFFIFWTSYLGLKMGGRYPWTLCRNPRVIYKWRVCEIRVIYLRPIKMQSRFRSWYQSQSWTKVKVAKWYGTMVLWYKWMHQKMSDSDMKDRGHRCVLV